MNRLLAILTLSVLTACGGGSTPEPQAVTSPPPELRVFIFAGQSNMNGSDAVISLTTGVLDMVDVGEQTDIDRASLFTMATPSTGYAWGDIRGHDGSHWGRPTLDGKKVKIHGPEVGFNRTIGGNVAIIKYANNYQATEGGRSAWVKPGSRWQAWQAFVDAQLATIGKPYKVAGFIWLQGIDDGLLVRDKQAYKADLLQVITDVRSKFGNVPVVVGRSVNSYIAGNAAMTPIRDAQVEVGNLPGNGWISVDDLEIVGDHHLSAAAQLVSGQRFASEYKRLR